MSVRLLSAFCAVLIAMATPAAPSFAHDYGPGHGHGYGKGYGDHRDKHHHKYKHKQKHKYKHHGYARPSVVWKHGYTVRPRHAHPAVRYHHYRPLPHYPHKHRHAHKRGAGNDLLYAILALQIIDLLNDSQRDSHGWAQSRAVAAPLGETIRWNDGGAFGSVTATRDGVDEGGRYCREFQHDVTVGNRTQQGYGVACRQPDGSWQIVS